MNWRILLFGLALIAFGVAQADSIVLKNGAVIRGTVQNVDEDPFYLKFSSGRISFYHREVIEIRIDGHESDESSWTIPKDTRASIGDPVEFSSDEESVHPVVPLNDEQQRLFRRLMVRLHDMNNEDEDSGFGVERQKLVRSLAGIGPNVAPHLENEMKEGNPESYRYLLIALAKVAPARGAKHAEDAALTHSDSTVRVTAVSLLAKRNPDKHCDTLREAYNDTQAPVRLSAIQGLARCKTSDVASVFIDALMDDPMPAVRVAARTALETTTGQRFETDAEWLEWYSMSANTSEEHANLAASLDEAP